MTSQEASLVTMHHTAVPSIAAADTPPSLGSISEQTDENTSTGRAGQEASLLQVMDTGQVGATVAAVLVQDMHLSYAVYAAWRGTGVRRANTAVTVCLLHTDTFACNNQPSVPCLSFRSLHWHQAATLLMEAAS